MNTPEKVLTKRMFEVLENDLQFMNNLVDVVHMEDEVEQIRQFKKLVKGYHSFITERYANAEEFVADMVAFGKVIGFEVRATQITKTAHA